MYFGVNLILMLDYRLSFDIDVKNGEGIEVLIISRKDVPAWKNNNNSYIKAYYNNSGVKINDIFTSTISDTCMYAMYFKLYSLSNDGEAFAFCISSLVYILSRP